MFRWVETDHFGSGSSSSDRRRSLEPGGVSAGTLKMSIEELERQKDDTAKLLEQKNVEMKEMAEKVRKGAMTCPGLLLSCCQCLVHHPY